MSEATAPETQPALASPESFDPRTQEVLDLSMKLIRVPGVSIPESQLDMPRINETLEVAREFAERSGLSVIEMPADAEHPFPFLVVSFNDDGASTVGRSKVALVGHIDVVGAQSPEQFNPKIEGDMLVGRGAADMKTVVATQLVWMAEQQKKPGAKPPVAVMISCTEENGSTRPNGAQHAIDFLQEQFGTQFELAIVGERTGEMESMGTPQDPPQVGPICDANRGWRWYRGEGDGRKNGSKALGFIADAVREGRSLAANGNADASSDRMKVQKNWRTGFVSSFAQIGADPELAAVGPNQVYRISKTGEAKHAAAMTPDSPTLVEEFEKIHRLAAARFGEEKVKVRNVSIGQDGNFNTVTGGGEIELVVLGDISTVGDVSEFLKNSASGLTVELSSASSVPPQSLSPRPPVFGLDIREVPEHTPEINRWLSHIRAACARAGFDFVTVNDGDGWVCPEDNDHMARLRAAYEEVRGLPSPALGKLHGNDGRFFNGNAVVFGQTGISPHGPKEAHYIPSILPYLQILDRFAASYAAA